MKEWPPKSKRSEMVAHAIIRQIIEDGLATEDKLGTEEELLQRFGVARSTFRQALRQLEWQGAVRIQRGARGGLRAATPSSYIPMFAMKVYFERAAVPMVQLRQAFQMIQRLPLNAPSEQPNKVAELFLQATDGQLTAALTTPSEDTPRPTHLSERVAYAITSEIGLKNLQPGDKLGSEADLQIQHGVGRGVMREASSLLELNRVISIRRGAAGGIFVQSPTPDFVIYITAAYLALAKISPCEIGFILLAMERALAQYPARETLTAVNDAPNPKRDTMLEMSDVALVHAKTLENIVLETFLRVLRCYWLQFR